MGILRDQRTMVGASPHGSPLEVEAAWHAWQLQEGFRGFAKRGFEWGLVETGETLPAYVSAGRWVADCPACGGGLAAWPENPRGCCLDCGRIYGLSYPSRQAIRAAEEALAARPESARNWRPEAEPPSRLREENEEHGFPRAAEAATVDDLYAEVEARLEERRVAISRADAVIRAAHGLRRTREG